jgi:peptide/nickel transport system substrate-binding protein
MPAISSSKMIGTGPFKLEKLHAEGRRFFRAQRRLLGRPGAAGPVEISFYDDYQPQILALQGGQIDFIQQMPVLQASASSTIPASR